MQKTTFVPSTCCTNALSSICAGVRLCHWLQSEMMSIESGVLRMRLCSEALMAVHEPNQPKASGCSVCL